MSVRLRRDHLCDCKLRLGHRVMVEPAKCHPFPFSAIGSGRHIAGAGEYVEPIPPVRKCVRNRSNATKIGVLRLAAVRFNRNKLPKPRPAAGGGSLLDQPAMSATHGEGPAFFQWSRRPPSWRGDRLLLLRAIGHAGRLQRTAIAGWVSGRADGRAQFHHGDVEIAGPIRRNEAFGQLPQSPGRFRMTRIILDGVQPAEHTGDVAIEQGRLFSERDRRNRACRVAADTGKAEQCLHVGRDLRFVIGNNCLGRGVKIAGARVIAESLPEPEDLLLRCRRQINQRGEFLRESRKVRDDGRHLSLLKHEFADQHVIRIWWRGAPGEIAPVAVVPTK